MWINSNYCVKKQGINGVFNHLCLGETENHTDLLMVAPHCMISHIFKYIDEQIELAKQGKEAYIGFKCNSVTSKKMIDKLIETASSFLFVSQLTPSKSLITYLVRLLVVIEECNRRFG